MKISINPFYILLSKVNQAEAIEYNLNNEKSVVAHILDFYSREIEKIQVMDF